MLVRSAGWAVNRIGLTQPGDMRTLFTTQTTAVNSDLAKLYGLTSASPDLLWPIGVGLNGRNLYSETRMVRE